MPQILVEALAKTYRVAERAPGLTGATARPRAPPLARDPCPGRRLVQPRSRRATGLHRPQLAGKATTVKILSGILRPTSGPRRVGGLVPYGSRAPRGGIGVVSASAASSGGPAGDRRLRPAWPTSTASRPERYRHRRDELVARLRLEPLLDQPVRQLSLGTRMPRSSPRPCCTIPRSCSSTSRPSVSTRRPSRPCAPSCGGSTASRV